MNNCSRILNVCFRSLKSIESGPSALFSFTVLSVVCNSAFVKFLVRQCVKLDVCIVMFWICCVAKDLFY